MWKRDMHVWVIVQLPRLGDADAPGTTPCTRRSLYPKYLLLMEVMLESGSENNCTFLYCWPSVFFSRIVPLKPNADQKYNKTPTREMTRRKSINHAQGLPYYVHHPRTLYFVGASTSLCKTWFERDHLPGYIKGYSHSGTYNNWHVRWTRERKGHYKSYVDHCFVISPNMDARLWRLVARFHTERKVLQILSDLYSGKCCCSDYPQMAIVMSGLYNNLDSESIMLFFFLRFPHW